MKKILLASFALMAYSASLTSCKTTDEPTPRVDTTDNFNYSAASSARTTTNNSPYTEPANATLTGVIKTNTVLKAGQTYTMKGFVYVIGGATLKIEPGVKIIGDKDTKGSLIITRNGKIDAQGTATQPIVFTSAQAAPAPGDWGGVILLGNSTNNSSFNGTAGLQVIEGGVNNSLNYGIHGGTDANDNSGTMKYVRIEYAGIAFQPNNEINGLTMGSVGAGTTLDYIQVSYSGDDSYEWFGGTVNPKHLIAYRGTDDDFDTDNGFSGKVQFGIGLRDPAIADFPSGNGQSNGFESDNDASGTTSLPQTKAVFSNMTMIGPKANTTTVSPTFGRGALIRRNSAESIVNSIFLGWGVGIRVDGKATNDNFTTGNAVFANNYIVNADKVADTAGGASNATSPINPATYFTTANAAWGNTMDTDLATAKLTSYIMGTTFNPLPVAGSPALSGAAFTNSKLSGLETVSYRGAVGSTAWYTGWTKF